jgi:hypothetical protein
MAGNAIAVANTLLIKFDAGKLDYMALCNEFNKLINKNPNQRNVLLDMLNTCQDEPETPYVIRKRLR